MGRKKQLTLEPRKKAIGCPTCGQPIVDGEAPHETIDRIVRTGQKFSGHVGGEVVAVEVQHLSHGSVAKATISVEEWEAQNHRARTPIIAGPSSVEMAKNFSKQARANWLNEKKRREASAKRAAEKAVDAHLAHSSGE